MEKEVQESLEQKEVKVAKDVVAALNTRTN